MALQLPPEFIAKFTPEQLERLRDLYENTWTSAEQAAFRMRLVERFPQHYDMLQWP